jgi:hypothetical protein
MHIYRRLLHFLKLDDLSCRITVTQKLAWEDAGETIDSVMLKVCTGARECCEGEIHDMLQSAILNLLKWVVRKRGIPRITVRIESVLTEHLDGA